MIGYFADGLPVSAKSNMLGELGIETAHSLSKKTPLVIRYIQGVVAIPKTYDRTAKVMFGKDSVKFLSESGVTAETKVRYSFLKSGSL